MSPVRLRPPHVRLPARPPSAHRTTPCVLLAQATRVPPFHFSFCTLKSKLFSSASATKILACPLHETCAKLTCRGTHPRTRPSFVFQWRACVQMKQVWPLCVRARLRRDRRPRCTSYLHCTARHRLLSLSSCRACRGRPLSSAAPGTRRRSGACCSGRISCPMISQARWRRRRTA